MRGILLGPTPCNPQLLLTFGETPIEFLGRTVFACALSSITNGSFFAAPNDFGDCTVCKAISTAQRLDQMPLRGFNVSWKKMAKLTLQAAEDATCLDKAGPV
mmetsp:Transcript_10178/g.28037  ORF Transcript_10178/g.28037 Transcript_10178/m.28037 type:complete len:102 (+) Transcript_10178:657-962(+)